MTDQEIKAKIIELLSGKTVKAADKLLFETIEEIKTIARL